MIEAATGGCEGQFREGKRHPVGAFPRTTKGSLRGISL